MTFFSRFYDGVMTFFDGFYDGVMTFFGQFNDGVMTFLNRFCDRVMTFLTKNHLIKLIWVRVVKCWVRAVRSSMLIVKN